MKTYLSEVEVKQMFWREVAPYIPRNDRPALRQAFNDFTDQLQKDGQITEFLYSTITMGGY